MIPVFHKRFYNRVTNIILSEIVSQLVCSGILGLDRILGKSVQKMKSLIVAGNNFVAGFF